jgi:hypothetical protein
LENLDIDYMVKGGIGGIITKEIKYDSESKTLKYRQINLMLDIENVNDNAVKTIVLNQSEEQNLRLKIIESGFLDSTDSVIQEGPHITDSYTHTLKVTLGSKNRSISWDDGAQKLIIPKSASSILKILNSMVA